MSELNFNERQIGDVTILDLDGEIRFGESTVILRDCILRLKEQNKNKVVLNLAGITYMDSSGSGELVFCHKSLRGMMKIASPLQRIKNALIIQKLIAVFEVYDSVEEAVKAFARKPVRIICPVYSCGNQVHFYLETPPASVICGSCGTEFRVTPVPSVTNQIAINALHLPTYEDERISIILGTTTTIRIVGRLDLFASDVLERAWLTVPPPRRVIFLIDPSNELNPAGVQKLLVLCSNKGRHNAAVIVSKRNDTATFFPAKSPVYNGEEDAIRALGDIAADRGAWVIESS